MIVFSSVWGTGRTLSSSLPLLNDRLVALTIPIPFDDCGIFGFYDGCHRRRDKRCCESLRIKWLLLLRLVDNFEFFSLFRFPYSCAGPKEPNGGELFYESAGSWEI
jgi:hypothetical protein